jgi:hypothetical protein
MASKSKAARKAAAKAKAAAKVVAPEEWVPPQPLTVRDKESKIHLAIEGSIDLGTPERHKRGRITVMDLSVVGEDLEGRASVNLEVSVFDRMLNSGRLGRKGTRDYARRREAGEWLHTIYHGAGIHQRTTASYNPTQIRGQGEMSDREAWNRRCFRDMWKEMPEIYADMLECVVCHGQDVGSDLDEAVRTALDYLADWRGI